MANGWEMLILTIVISILSLIAVSNPQEIFRLCSRDGASGVYGSPFVDTAHGGIPCAVTAATALLQLSHPAAASGYAFTPRFPSSSPTPS